MKPSTVLSAVMLMLGVTGAGSDRSAASQLTDVVEEYWQWRLREFPTFATYRGEHAYNHQLEEFTFEAWARRKREISILVSRLDKVNVTQLTAAERQDLEVLRADLTTYLEGYKWRLYGALNPISFLEGIHRPPAWIPRMPFKTLRHYRIYESRLRMVVRQINQTIDLMKEAIRLRRTNHQVSMEGVIEQLQHFMVSPGSSAFYSPYLDYLHNSSINVSHWDNLRRQALLIIKTLVQPAYKRLIDFLNNEYMNNTRKEYGVGSFEDGRKYYEGCLKFHLSMDATPEEIRDTGLREVERISKRMEQIMKDMGFNGSLPQFFNHLRTTKRKEYYTHTQEELLAGYRHIIFDRIQPNLHKVIKKIPNAHLRVEPMRYNGPAGSYSTGVFWVNLRKPETRPSYTMMALSLHEANPGHHLQVSYTLEQDLPKFRRYLSASNYYSVPFNFPWYTAYTEGWALYSEYLGEEMELYNASRLELLGRYSTEIFRACRLVVDTGIHAFGMSRQEAIEYMANYTATPRKQIETEINRYITWPGQACAYKMGEMKILEMRKKAERFLGDKFDQRDFHDVILQVGRAPLQLLEKEINTWMEQYALVSGAARPLQFNLWTTLSLLLWELQVWIC